jgi:hypothetical protein
MSDECEFGTKAILLMFMKNSSVPHPTHRSLLIAHRFLGLLLLIALSTCAFANRLSREDPLKVETIAALSDASVSEGVRGALDAKGLRVVGADGKAVCEVWFRKEVPTASRELPGALFAKIPDGALVGVIRFLNQAEDFRGQPIKAGYYTLRYGLILEDGNHLGVSPSKDFVMLCPVGKDTDPNKNFTPEETIKLSREAVGSGHPSPWCLVPVSSDKGLPKAIKNEHEHVILETSVTTKSGPLPLGLIVVGKTEG